MGMIKDSLTIEKLQTENTQLKEQIQSLVEQLEWFKKQLFGKRSEKIVELVNETQLIFPGCEPIEPNKSKKQLIPAHERKKSERNGQDKITLPDNLPIERQIIDLPEEEKICKETGLPLIKIGEEITRKLAFRVGSHFIKEIV